MNLIQILVILFCLFAIGRVGNKFKRRELRVSEFLMWLVFWIAAGVAFAIPDSLTYLANVLGIGRGADLVLYVMAVVVFYLMFRIFVRLERLEKDITKVVRKEAIDEGTRLRQDSGGEAPLRQDSGGEAPLRQDSGEAKEKEIRN